MEATTNSDQARIGVPPPDGDRNWRGVLLGVNWAVFTPALIVVVLRLYSRTFFTRNLGWDDFFMLLTELWNIAGMAFVMLECRYGLGRHKYFINKDHYIGFLKYNYLDWNQVIITLALCKISICLFLFRISKFDKWRKFLYCVIAVIVLTHIPLEMLFLLQCLPISKNWYMSKPGKCFSKQQVENIIIIQGTFSIVTDVLLAAFPVLLLYHMHLPRRQKILLNMLLGLGIVTALVCIVRTAFSYQTKANDLTWQGIPNALCRMLEINFGIIAACAPMVRTFGIHIKRKLTVKSTSLPSTRRTPASELDWYSPPTITPWYKRIQRNIWKPPPKLDLEQPSASSSNRSIPPKNPSYEIEPPRPTRPKSKSIPRALWPQHYERPANSTWAKNDSLKRTDSIDLPIQGARSSTWIEGDDNKRASAGGFRFDRGLT